jgi:hypothetical protein
MLDWRPESSIVIQLTCWHACNDCKHGNSGWSPNQLWQSHPRADTLARGARSDNTMRTEPWGSVVRWMPDERWSWSKVTLFSMLLAQSLLPKQRSNACQIDTKLVAEARKLCLSNKYQAQWSAVVQSKKLISNFEARHLSVDNAVCSLLQLIYSFIDVTRLQPTHSMGRPPIRLHFGQ